MMVGIFEAPLICSWAGNLWNAQVEKVGQGVEENFDPPGYPLDFGHYPRIKHTVIRCESVPIAPLSARLRTYL